VLFDPLNVLFVVKIARHTNSSICEQSTGDTTSSIIGSWCVNRLNRLLYTVLSGAIFQGRVSKKNDSLEYFYTSYESLCYDSEKSASWLAANGYPF